MLLNVVSSYLLVGCIEGGGGFIEEQDLRIFIKSTLLSGFFGAGLLSYGVTKYSSRTNRTITFNSFFIN